MTLDAALLDILCCPITRLPLQWLPEAQRERLNRAIAEGRVQNREGTRVEEPLEQALMTRDGKLAYPVRDGVPVLLEEQAIPLVQIEDR
ncbi:MAG TPA: Trm112 family protein [Gammaproteobacteria bacterium]